MTFLASPPRLTESQFQRQVIRYAELRGWRYYHGFDSRRSPEGFPDLVLVRARHPKPRVVFAELKADRGRVTDTQRDWITELRACGMEAYIWRPVHFESIMRILR